jgi:hypothetical protein
VGVVEEEQGAAVGKGNVDGKKASTTTSTDQKGEFNCCCKEWLSRIVSLRHDRTYHGSTGRIANLLQMFHGTNTLVHTNKRVNVCIKSATSSLVFTLPSWPQI